MRMLALAAAGLLALGGVRLVSAGDLAPLTQDEQTRIRHLVDDLGSDDFRVREAATKALMEFGERARTALVAAQKHESAEVRFRADQLLRRLDGANHEKKLEGSDTPGGDAGAGGKAPSPGALPGGWPQPFGDDMGRWGEELQRRVREMEEEMARAFGGDRLRTPFGLGRALRLKADGAEYSERGGTGHLTIVDQAPDGRPTATHLYEGKSLDEILAAHPELKDKPGVASLVEQAKKAHEEKPWKGFGFGVGPGMGSSFSFQSNGVQVEQTPGHVKVTVKETGPDGKEESKTYEGTDLEALKAEHPELKDKLGGLQLKIHVGPGPGNGFGFGTNPFGKDGWPKPPGLKEKEGGDEEGEGDEMGDAAHPTGPFGLQIGPLDDALRAQTGLDTDTGVLVRWVREDSQASKIGVKAYDIVTAVNGAKVGSSQQLRKALHDLKSDAALSIDVIRTGKPTTLKR